MIRLFFVLTFIFTAEPAAACHRFSRWYYPWPQRCQVVAHWAPVAPARPAPRTWSVEITRLPESLALPPLTPVEGQEADDEAKARLLLRSAVGIH